MQRLAGFALAALVALIATPALSQSVDWNSHRDADTVVIVTTQEDGAALETTIWLCVMNGQGYVRGGSGRWVANSLRDGNVKLRVGESELVLRAEKLTDSAEIERVTAAFREKYGFSDTLATLIRGEPTIFRLSSR